MDRKDCGVLLTGTVLALFIILFRETIREHMPKFVSLFLSNLQMRIYNEILAPMASLDTFSLIFICVLGAPVIIVIGMFFLYPE